MTSKGMSLPDEFLECASKAKCMDLKHDDVLPDPTISYQNPGNLGGPDNHPSISSLSPPLDKLKLEARSALDARGLCDPFQLSDIEAIRSETSPLHAATAKEEHGSSSNQSPRCNLSGNVENAFPDENIASTACWENFEILDETIPRNTADICRELDAFYDAQGPKLDETEKLNNAPVEVPLRDGAESQGIAGASSQKSRFSSSSQGHMESSDSCNYSLIANTTELNQDTSLIRRGTENAVAQCPPASPTFRVVVPPPHEYFSPKWSLWWDDRDFQKQWRRDMPYNLSNRPDSTCASKALPVGKTPSIGASSEIPRSFLRAIREEKGAHVPGQSKELLQRLAIQPSPTQNLTKAANSPERSVEAPECSDVSSGIPVEHSQIFGMHKINAGHTLTMPKWCNTDLPPQK